ncbi:MAG: hypothetical protein ACTSUE_06935 [Promethearchaeota archaeon]
MESEMSDNLKNERFHEKHPMIIGEKEGRMHLLETPSRNSYKVRENSEDSKHHCPICGFLITEDIGSCLNCGYCMKE